jgi:hypothetical protein
MGCCGSKEDDKKNKVGPAKRKLSDADVHIVVTEEPTKKERRQLKPEEAPWRRKKEEKPPGCFFISKTKHKNYLKHCINYLKHRKNYLIKTLLIS